MAAPPNHPESHDAWSAVASVQGKRSRSFLASPSTLTLPVDGRLPSSEAEGAGGGVLPACYHHFECAPHLTSVLSPSFCFSCRPRPAVLTSSRAKKSLSTSTCGLLLATSSPAATSP